MNLQMATFFKSVRHLTSPKHLTLCFLFVFTAGLTAQTIDTAWNHEIEVMTGDVEFSKVVHPAYYTYIYETSKSKVQSLLATEVESRSAGKSKSKGVIQGEELKLPGFDEHGFTALAQVDDVKNMKDVTQVSMAFIHEGSALDENMSAEADAKAREMLRTVSVALNKSVVSGQIADAQKELDNLTKKRDAVISQKESLEQSINKSESKLLQLTADSVKYEGELLAAQAEVKSAQVIASSSTADAKSIKKLSKAKDKEMSAQQKLQKNTQAKLKEQNSIRENEATIPLKEKEIEDYNLQITQQEAIISALNRKQQAIE